MNKYIFFVPVIIGFLLDAVFGDPYNMPHPIRLIGNLISKLDKLLYRDDASDRQKFIRGMILALTVIVLSAVCPLIILIICYRINIYAGIIVQGMMCYYLIAAKCLKTESMKVYSAIEKDDTEGARYAVSMIVGRDTDRLDRNGIIKAAVETVAENTSDGVIAPLFYMIIGGAVLGFAYKAVNTMDSMIGYKNDKYMYFGRFAAKLDDILNYIPARLTAVFMIIAAFISGYNGRNAFKIWRRDRRKHKSPNSAQTEAVCAGALEIQLAGDAYYFGKLLKKDTIGDDLRPIENEDIKRANVLMYVTSVLMPAVMMLIIVVVTSI